VKESWEGLIYTIQFQMQFHCDTDSPLVAADTHVGDAKRNQIYFLSLPFRDLLSHTLSCIYTRTLTHSFFSSIIPSLSLSLCLPSSLPHPSIRFLTGQFLFLIFLSFSVQDSIFIVFSYLGCL